MEFFKKHIKEVTIISICVVLVLVIVIGYLIYVQERHGMTPEFSAEKWFTLKPAERLACPPCLEQGACKEEVEQFEAGWYGFVIKSRYEENLKEAEIKYKRLGTYENITFNELCKKINKKCTTTLSVVAPSFSPDDEKCSIYRDDEILAFCE